MTTMTDCYVLGRSELDIKAILKVKLDRKLRDKIRMTRMVETKRDG